MTLTLVPIAEKISLVKILFFFTIFLPPFSTPPLNHSYLKSLMYKSILKITIFVCQNPKLIVAHSVTVVRAQTVRNTFTSGKTWVKNVLLLLHERVRVFFFFI